MPLYDGEQELISLEDYGQGLLPLITAVSLIWHSHLSHFNHDWNHGLHPVDIRIIIKVTS